MNDNFKLDIDATSMSIRSNSKVVKYGKSIAIYVTGKV